MSDEFVILFISLWFRVEVGLGIYEIPFFIFLPEIIHVQRPRYEEMEALKCIVNYVKLDWSKNILVV